MKIMITLFGALGTLLLLSLMVAMPERASFTVESNARKLYKGSELITTDTETLVYEGTKIELEARTNLVVRSIKHDIEIFASRGSWSITPDREITTCTRAVCAVTESPITVRYYTPGEVVDISAGGHTIVSYKDKVITLKAGDRLRIDELTGYTSIQSPNDGIETDSTP